MIEQKASDDTVATNPTRRRKPATKRTFVLASNCLGEVFPPIDPPWIVCAELEPHGAICIMRFTNGEPVEQFELSSVEVDALVALNRQRKALLKRYMDERSLPTWPELTELDECSF